MKKSLWSRIISRWDEIERKKSDDWNELNYININVCNYIKMLMLILVMITITNNNDIMKLNIWNANLKLFVGI